MKKIIFGLIIIIMVVSIIPVFAQVNTVQINKIKYCVPPEFIELVEQALAQAETKKEYERISKILNMISNPEIITAGSGVDPNGKYNFGQSKYEKAKTYPDGSAVWQRID